MKEKKLKKKQRNFFFIIGFIVFFIWMILFDSADFITLYKLIMKYRKLKYQQEYYIKNIEKLEEYKKAILYDKKMLEKIAREKYYMKKPSEHIYIIK